jgi:hypothetical protein
MTCKTNYKGKIIYAEQANALYSTNPSKETILKLYKVLAVPGHLHGSECWTFTKQQLQQIKSSAMRFLR